jgi:hypothetical protein
MLNSKSRTWRDDIDALEFQPADHPGACMIHRRAFRTLLRTTPLPQQCVDYYHSNRDTFQAAARAKVRRSPRISSFRTAFSGSALRATAPGKNVAPSSRKRSGTGGWQESCEPPPGA